MNRESELSIVSVSHPPLSIPAANVQMGQPSSSTSPTVVMRQSWQALLRWWMIALPAGLILALCGAAGVWLTFEKQYRAAAWIQIQESPTHLAYPAQDNPRRFVQNQIELLRSPLVLGPVLGDPEIAAMPQLQRLEDPTHWLSKRLRIAGIGESELFEVSFDSSDGAGAARLVNAVVKSYLALRVEHDTSRNQRMLELLDEEKELRAQEVARLRENVRELNREVYGKDPFNGLPVLDREGDAVAASHIDKMLTQLSEVEVNRKLLEMQMATFKEAVDQPLTEVPAPLLKAAVERHPDILQLKALISGKKTMLDRIEEAAARGKQDASYQRVEREVVRLEQSLERTRKSLAPQVRDELLANAADQQNADMAELEQSLNTAKTEESLLRSQYQEKLKAAGQTGNQSLELEFAKAELSREEKVFDLIAHRALALRTETRAPARVSLMKSATVPVIPVENMPLKRILLVMFGGFLAPFALALLWERWVGRIADTQQLDHQTSLRVVGEVARLPLHPAATRHSDQEISLFEESVDSLRTCLLLGNQDEEVHVIAVASAVSGEGKTSVATQLAVSIARATRRPTLIIDADMRSPDVHRVFQIDNELGLASILQGEATLEEALHTDWNEYIHVLPAGRATTSPHTLLNSQQLRELLAQCRANYSHIVIDTPPILLASESLVVAKEADGTLLCTMRDYSRERQVHSAYDRLRAVGARTLGTVLSGIPSRQYAAKYGNYSYT